MVRLAAVRSFYDFAQRMGLFTGDNPTLRVKRPKQQQPLPQGLSWPALRRLLAAIPPHTRSGCRDRAIVLTILLTGLRRREVLSLTAGDLTHTGAVVYTARTKGGVTRRRELPVPALEAIRAAWERQGQPLCALSAQTRLFPVTPGGFAKNLARYARRAGLGHLSPHALRHSAAKLRRVTGASIEEVSHLLGHANLATTAIYLSRLEGEADSGWHAAAALLLGEPPS
jgi:site-specific recombinase XerD